MVKHENIKKFESILLLNSFENYVHCQKLLHYLSINLRISSVVRPSFVFGDLLAVEFGKFTI